MYFEAGPHAWDVCAACVIVQEAQGMCVNYHSDGPVDVGERTMICVRGSTDIATSDQLNLINELRAKIVPDFYEHD